MKNENVSSLKIFKSLSRLNRQNARIASLSRLFLLIVLSIITIISCKTIKKIPEGKGYPIKTAAYWTCPKMTDYQADSLSWHDLVITCVENQFNNRESLVRLKKLNPDIKLLCYYNTPEIWENTSAATPWQNQVIKELKESRSEWLLKTDKQEQVIFWKGMMVVNMSEACPKIDGQTYAEWIAEKLNEEIFSDSIWSGHFLDNGGGNFYWVNNWPDNPATGGIDANCDGQPDSQIELDNSWYAGIAQYLKIAREKNGKDFIIIANKGSLDFIDLVDGKFFENFPNDYLGDKQDGGWQQCLRNAKKTGPYTIFQVPRQSLKFGLASTLLLDNVYIAIGQDVSSFFPQFNLITGQALENAKKSNKSGEGRYYRKYKEVKVEVWPGKKIGMIKE
jgi:hypothetical protein